jgi:SAM-dependent methyltransferase
MRTVRVFLVGLVVGWASLAILLVRFVGAWLRERDERSPCPASQAGMLLHPLRPLIQPVGPTLQKFHLKGGDTVLEIGPGPGYFTVEASRIVGPQGRVVCLDLQPGMLTLLRQRLGERQVANAHPVAGDALDLPLADHSVGAAFLVTVLGEIPDRPRALAELRRVMRPGGVLSFSEALGDPDYVFRDSLEDLCRASGFRALGHDRQRLGYTMSFAAPDAQSSAGAD